MARHVWTGAQEQYLRKNYQALGAKACHRHIAEEAQSRGGVPPTLPAVRQRARKLGLVRKLDEIRVPSNDRIDDILRECHASGSQTAWADACRRTGMPRRWVRSRAISLGLKVVMTHNARPMSDEETRFILKNLHRSPEWIAATMTANGWPRTKFSVEYFVRSRGLGGTDTSHITTREAAEYLGVNFWTVRRWVESGLLVAEMRNPMSDKDKVTRVAEADLAAFILLNPEKVDFAKVEAAQTKAWFLDLISRFPKPPSQSDDYLRRRIESLHTFRPDYDAERLATKLGIEEKTVLNVLNLLRKRLRKRADGQARRAAEKEAA